MKSKSRLDKLKMPEKKKMDVSELEMELSPEEGSEPEMEMSEEEMPAQSDSPEQGAAIDLSSVSDDELKAELEKRGLMGDLEGQSPEAPSEEYPA